MSDEPKNLVIPNPSFTGVRDLLFFAAGQATADPSSGYALVRDDNDLIFTNHESRITNAHTLRVATAGGTAAARFAGPKTAICPSNHSAAAPTGR